MEIVQIDSKTIKIVRSGFTFCLRYCFTWDKSPRTPESIVRENNVVKAFFLTSVIKDTIVENEDGFSISRLWNIVPGGDIALFFTIDLLLPKNVPYFFPCMLTDDHVPQKQIMVSGERLSFPSSVFLFPDGMSVFFALDIPKNDNEQGSIGITRSNLEGIPSVRAEIAFPPRELLDARVSSIPGFAQGAEETYYASEGNLVRQMQLNVIIAPEKEIFPLTSVSFLKKTQESDGASTAFTKAQAVKLVKEGIDICLTDLLVDKDGAFGPRLSQKSDTVSSLVCSGLSYLIQKTFENNFEMNEMALKLADFCLKSQHPNGMFLESFKVQRKIWQNGGTNGSERNSNGDEAEYATIEHSARIADYLFSIFLIQRERKIPAEKYLMAGKRFIEMFFDPKKRGLAEIGSRFSVDTLEPFEKSRLCLELIDPLITLYTITGDEKYKKAVGTVKSEFFGETFSYTSLPARADGDKPDFATSLLLLRTATSLEALGIRLKDKEVFVNMALPWIYFNKAVAASSPEAQTNTRGVLESFEKCRIAFRGFELAYYLLRIVESADKKPLVKHVKNIASYLIDSGSRIQLGVPWFHHTSYNNEPKEKNVRPLLGSFDSAHFVREACYLLRIANNFPEMLK